MSIRRTGTLGVHDAKIMIMEEKVNKEELKRNVMLRLVRFLKESGWEFTVPYEDYDWLHKDRAYTKNHPHFAESRRKGIKDGLEMEIGVSGRCLEIEFWENIVDHTADNSNGGRYIFDKESKMPYRQLCRLRATKLKILWFFSQYHDYELTECSNPVFPRRETGIDFLKREYTESWHHDGSDIFHPTNCKVSDYNAKSADGDAIKHGQQVWTTDYSGRWITGTAYRNLNNMWWVLCGKWDHYNKACFEIFTAPPVDIRERMPVQVRAEKLEKHIAAAVKKEDFLKAHKLKLALNGITGPKATQEAA